MHLGLSTLHELSGNIQALGKMECNTPKPPGTRCHPIQEPRNNCSKVLFMVETHETIITKMLHLGEKPLKFVEVAVRLLSVSGYEVMQD